MKVSRSSLLASAVAVALLTGSGSLHAEAAAAWRPVKLDIAPQALDDALKEFARQAGVQLIYHSKVAKGLQAPRILGDLDPREALSRLLGASGLRYEFLDADTVAIFAAELSSNLGGAATRTAAWTGGGGSGGMAHVAEPATPLDMEQLVVTAPRYVPGSNSTATKMDIPLIETPQSVSVITRDQLDVLHLAEMEEAVRYTAGIRGGIFGSDDRYDWMTLRGFRPAQYLDGLRLPKGSYAWSKLDLKLADAIEVMKGPSSGLYGAIAPGGMVNTISRRPQRETSGSIEVQGGSFDSYQGALDTTGAITDSVLYRLTGLYRENGTQVDFGEDERYAIAPSLTFAPIDRLTLTVLGKFQSDTYGTSIQFLPAAGTKLPNPNGVIPLSRTTGEPGYNLFDREERHIGYALDYQVNEDIRLHQGLRYSEVDVFYRAVTGAGLYPDQRTLARSLYTVDEVTDAFTVDNHFAINFATGTLEHKLLAGLDYGRFGSDFADYFAFLGGPTLDIFEPVYGQPIAPPPLLSMTASEQRQTGVYLQDQIKWDKFIVTAGLRHDWAELTSRNKLTGVEQEQDDAEFSGRIGFNYVFESGFAPYVAYSKSFEQALGSGFDGRPFQPVTGEQIEAGVKYQPERGDLFITLAFYNLTQQNVVVSDPDHVGFNEQTGEVEINGAELEGVARINERFSINGSITYMDSEVTKTTRATELGKWLRETPQVQASLIADYTFQTGVLAGFGAGFGVRHIGKTYGDRDNLWGVDSYTLYDAILHYDRGPWRLSINANNVFDDTYLSNCASINQCYYGKRRTVFATLTKRWGTKQQ